jgi:hypothetical protein
MVPEDFTTVGGLEGVHVRDGLHLQRPAVAFHMDDTVLLRNPDSDVRGPVDPSEADWFSAIDGQGAGHPEVVPSLTINHGCGDAGERALGGAEEVFDRLLGRGPSQGGY